MTLRKKFEAIVTQRQVGRRVEQHPASLYYPTQYVDYDVQLAWELYQAGHAEGIKEAARRCAELTSATRIAISVEYPEAFTSDPPAAQPDTPPTASSLRRL